MAQPQYVPLNFPTAGIDVSVCPSNQTAGTTRVGVNVCSYEPQQMTLSGGSRSGITPYIPGPVSGQSPIQEICCLVFVEQGS
jgi:hypothetical protein